VKNKEEERAFHTVNDAEPDGVPSSDLRMGPTFGKVVDDNEISSWLRNLPSIDDLRNIIGQLTDEERDKLDQL